MVSITHTTSSARAICKRSAPNDWTSTRQPGSRCASSEVLGSLNCPKRKRLSCFNAGIFVVNKVKSTSFTFSIPDFKQDNNFRFGRFSSGKKLFTIQHGAFQEGYSHAMHKAENIGDHPYWAVG